MTSVRNGKQRLLWALVGSHMLHPRHVWNVFYNARSNKCHPPTSQILHLPRKMTRTLDPRHVWNVIQCVEHDIKHQRHPILFLQRKISLRKTIVAPATTSDTWLCYSLTILILDDSTTWRFYYSTILLVAAAITWRCWYLTIPVID